MSYSSPIAPTADDFPQMDMATFMVSSAHDMKNSISVMTAYLESALQSSPPPNGEAHDVGTMTHQALYEAQRLNDHLIQILALYKMNEGLYPFDPNDVELRPFAEEALARVRPLADARGVTLELETTTEACAGYFDHELILSVVVQALHNAIKYTRDRVVLSARDHDGQLEWRVADNGAGFPEFMLARGFPVRQGVDFHTGSTGLGLYFASLAARMHRNRGRIGGTRLENGSASDGDLVGGCFILTLP